MDAKPDTKQGSTGANAREYEEFDPPFEWVKEDSYDNVLVFLPGFQKDRLKIQITSSEKLRVTGERPIGHNKWRHFMKEFPLTPDRDTNRISAKFEGGILYVKLPKLIPVPQAPKSVDPAESKKENSKPKPKSAPEPVAELIEPLKKSTTPKAADDDKLAPPKQQQQQQKQPPPPTKPAPPAEKPQTGPKTKDDDQQKAKTAIDADLKKDIKDVPNNTLEKKTVADAAAAAELLVPDSGKASGKTTPDKAEKKETQPPPESGPTKPKKKAVLPDGAESAINKDGEKKSSATEVIDRSAGNKSAGQKKGIFSGLSGSLSKSIPRTLVNVVIASLILVVLGFYVKNAIRFYERSSSSAEL